MVERNRRDGKGGFCLSTAMWRLLYSGGDAVVVAPSPHTAQLTWPEAMTQTESCEQRSKPKHMNSKTVQARTGNRDRINRRTGEDQAQCLMQVSSLFSQS